MTFYVVCRPSSVDEMAETDGYQKKEVINAKKVLRLPTIECGIRAKSPERMNFSMRSGLRM